MSTIPCARATSITTCLKAPAPWDRRAPSKPTPCIWAAFLYLVEGEAFSAIVVGELYGVNPAGMRLLDQLEEHPDWYQHRQMPVIDAKGQTLTA